MNDPSNKDKIFRVRFNVIATVPTLSHEFKPDQVTSLVRIHNKKTDSYKEAKGAPKKDETLTFDLRLLSQDYSTSFSNQIVKILLHDSGDKSEFFRGVKIDDILKKKDVQEKVWNTIKILQRFNVWVEAIVSFN